MAIAYPGIVSRSFSRKHFYCDYEGKRAEQKFYSCTFSSFKLVLNRSYCKSYIIIKRKKIFFPVSRTSWWITHLWTTGEKICFLWIILVYFFSTESKVQGINKKVFRTTPCVQLLITFYIKSILTANFLKKDYLKYFSFHHIRFNSFLHPV